MTINQTSSCLLTCFSVNIHKYIYILSSINTRTSVYTLYIYIQCQIDDDADEVGGRGGKVMESGPGHISLSYKYRFTSGKIPLGQSVH